MHSTSRGMHLPAGSGMAALKVRVWFNAMGLCACKAGWAATVAHVISRRVCCHYLYQGQATHFFVQEAAVMLPGQHSLHVD